MLKSLVTGQHRFSLRINPKCHYLYGNKYAWMCGGWAGSQPWGRGRFEGGSGEKKLINSFWMMRWKKYETIPRVGFTGRHGKRNICIQLFGQNLRENLKLQDLIFDNTLFTLETIDRILHFSKMSEISEWYWAWYRKSMTMNKNLFFFDKGVNSPPG